ncbi:hypothetical protein D3C78_1916070 [compost metagenome]
MDVGGLECAENIIKHKFHQATGYTTNFHGYKGYIFSSNTEWRTNELYQPYGSRTPYTPINVLRNTVRLLSNLKAQR